MSICVPSARRQQEEVHIGGGGGLRSFDVALVIGGKEGKKIGGMKINAHVYKCVQALDQQRERAALAESSQPVLQKLVTILVLSASGCRNSVGRARDVARIIGTTPVVVGAAAAAEEEVAATVADWMVLATVVVSDQGMALVRSGW